MSWFKRKPKVVTASTFVCNPGRHDEQTITTIVLSDGTVWTQKGTGYFFKDPVQFYDLKTGKVTE